MSLGINGASYGNVFAMERRELEEMTDGQLEFESRRFETYSAQPLLMRIADSIFGEVPTERRALYAKEILAERSEVQDATKRI